MIAIDDGLIETEDELNFVLDEMSNRVYNDKTQKSYEIFNKFLREFFEYNQRLTKMVQENLGEDLVPIIVITTALTTDLNAFNFYLASTDENREVSKRDEKAFYEYCDICFGGVEGLYDRYIAAVVKE